MKRRDFLRSMLCTAIAPPVIAAAVEPEGLATTITTSARSPLDGALTLEDIRAAMEIMRREPAPAHYMVYVHPDTLAKLQAFDGPAPTFAGPPVHVTSMCEGVVVVPEPDLFSLQVARCPPLLPDSPLTRPFERERQKLKRLEAGLPANDPPTC